MISLTGCGISTKNDNIQKAQIIQKEHIHNYENMLEKHKYKDVILYKPNFSSTESVLQVFENFLERFWILKYEYDVLYSKHTRNIQKIKNYNQELINLIENNKSKK